MADLLKNLVNKAGSSERKKILFPEAEDKRVMKAIGEIIRKKICHPVIIGKPEKISQDLKKIHPRLKQDDFSVIDPEDPKLIGKFSATLFQLRKKKNMTPSLATQLVKKTEWFAVMCLRAGLADGMVSGAATTTADVLRPALQIIRTENGSRASGAFLLLPRNHEPLLFADCAVNPDPDAREIAEIGAQTVKTAKLLGIPPRLALLSFSSHGSAPQFPQVQKMSEAAKILRKKLPRVKMDGELQADAALSYEVSRLKVPGSPLKGNANILIFPNLDSGNIGYKLVERLSRTKAIGTIMQGLKKPVNDLSRGCQTADIVYLTAITVLQTLS